MGNTGTGERRQQITFVALTSTSNEVTLVLLGALVLLCLAAMEVTGLSGALPATARLALRIPRTLLGFVYVLYVPGYWLTAALFPGKGDLDRIERQGLSLGLSIAWVSVLVLILDWLPWGLRLWPTLLGEIVSALLFATWALWSRAQLPDKKAYAPQLGWPAGLCWRSLTRLEQSVALVSAGALLLTGLTAASVFLVPSPDDYMTEFYVLGPEGQAENYPRDTAPGEIHSLTIGITNREREAAVYDVQVWAVDPWSGKEERVGRFGLFNVPRNHSLERNVTWYMPWVGANQKVEFRLFRDNQDDREEPYRLLQLWFDVHE